LLYTIDQFRLPLQAEYSAVVDLTNTFLNDYFRTNFQTNSLTIFLSSNTTSSGNNFIFGRPTQIDYNTSLSFASSSFIPTTDVVDQLLSAAFEGDSLTQYQTQLQGLPVSNLFSSASAIEFTSGAGVAVGAPATARRSLPLVGIGAAAGAGLFLVAVVAGGTMLLRREEEVKDPMAKCNECHMTVSDETYTGVSVDSQTISPSSSSDLPPLPKSTDEDNEEYETIYDNASKAETVDTDTETERPSNDKSDYC
jgi:hypothetical protein